MKANSGSKFYQEHGRFPCWRVYKMPRDKNKYLNDVISKEIERMLDDFVGQVFNEAPINYDKFIDKIFKLFKEVKWQIIL